MAVFADCARKREDETKFGILSTKDSVPKPSMKVFPWVLAPLLSVMAFAGRVSNDSVPRRIWITDVTILICSLKSSKSPTSRKALSAPQTHLA